MSLSREGDIRAATLALDIGHGSMRLPALPEAPLEIDGGGINIAYDGGGPGKGGTGRLYVNGETVAEVEKTLYIRRRPQPRD